MATTVAKHGYTDAPTHPVAFAVARSSRFASAGAVLTTAPNVNQRLKDNQGRRRDEQKAEGVMSRRGDFRPEYFDNTGKSYDFVTI
jgi:hypothetical protein